MKLLKDINPGAPDSDSYGYTVLNNNLYFSADDGTHSNELWVSDGTGLGTLMIKDIEPAGVSYPENLTVFNGKIYFQALSINAQFGFLRSK